MSTIAKLAGHASPVMTLNVYGHVAQDSLQGSGGAAERPPAAYVAKPISCRSCGVTGKPLPIVYGYPTPETFEAAQRGEVVLGGCVLTGDDPEWTCAACREPVATTVAIKPSAGGEPEGR